jgi:hypothetical protein
MPNSPSRICLPGAMPCSFAQAATVSNGFSIVAAQLFRRVDLGILLVEIGEQARAVHGGASARIFFLDAFQNGVQFLARHC